MPSDISGSSAQDATVDREPCHREFRIGELSYVDHHVPSFLVDDDRVLKQGSEPMHLIVDSTGLKLCGPGEWLFEKHGTRTRRTWRKLHIGVDADTGEIVAIGLTDPDVDDGAQVGPLLDQVTRPVVSFTGDGAFDLSVTLMQRSSYRRVRVRC